MRSMQQRLGILGTIAEFAYNQRKTKENKKDKFCLNYI
jgi:hypothetical protein